MRLRKGLPSSQKFSSYTVGPIFPLPESEKKLDFSPSLVEMKSPIRKIVGTKTNKRVAMKPKLVVSMNPENYFFNLSSFGSNQTEQGASHSLCNKFILRDLHVSRHDQTCLKGRNLS